MEVTFDPIFVFTWINYEHQMCDILLKIKFFKVTSDLSFRIGSSKLPEFAENQPTGPIVLQTLLIYPCKQYSITCNFKKCLRTYMLSVICGLKITSLTLLFSPNVTSAEVFWVILGYFGTYIYVYMDKLDRMVDRVKPWFMVHSSWFMVLFLVLFMILFMVW